MLRKLVVFALPFLASNIIQSFYNVADMLIVGNFSGTASMSGVNIGEQVPDKGGDGGPPDQGGLVFNMLLTHFTTFTFHLPVKRYTMIISRTPALAMGAPMPTPLRPQPMVMPKK